MVQRWCLFTQIQQHTYTHKTKRTVHTRTHTRTHAHTKRNETHSPHAPPDTQDFAVREHCEVGGVKNTRVPAPPLPTDNDASERETRENARVGVS